VRLCRAIGGDCLEVREGEADLDRGARAHYAELVLAFVKVAGHAIREGTLLAHSGKRPQRVGHLEDGERIGGAAAKAATHVDELPINSPVQ
jgi:hypothetical protein